MGLPVTTNIANSPTPAPASSVGFKVSKPGFNASTTAGENLVFDSSWPSLPIALEVNVPNTITGFSSPNIVIPHNLGFPPFAMVWAYGPDPNGSGINNVVGRFIAMTDDTNVYINGKAEVNPFYTNFTATKLRVLIYNLDLSTDIDYALAPGDTFNLPYDKDYGVKVTLPGKDISSTDMRDFAIHSRCQSPLILAVKTQQTVSPSNNKTVCYISKLSYPVWVYGFIKAGASGLASSLGVPAATYIPAPYYSQAYPRVFTDGFTAYLDWIGTGSFQDEGATILVLRDPMFASNPLTVQF
jgi:hypothetical protein